MKTGDPVNTLQIVEAGERTPALVQALLSIWESSVKTTHLFLSDAEIERIKQYVPQAIKEIPRLSLGLDVSGELVSVMQALAKRQSSRNFANANISPA